MTFEEEFIKQYRDIRNAVKNLQVKEAFDKLNTIIIFIKDRYKSDLDSIKSKAWLLNKVNDYETIARTLDIFGITEEVKKFFGIIPYHNWDEEDKTNSMLEEINKPGILEKELETPIEHKPDEEGKEILEVPKGNEPIIPNPNLSEMKDTENLFVPSSLSGFIGQEHIIKRILAEINAAKKRGMHHIDHILLLGNRGLGKSTLMKLIAKELDVNFELLDASQLGNDVRSQRAVQKFLQRISETNEPVVIAFDEIHALPKHIQTGLLTLLNDRVYSYLDDSGVTHNLPIKEFTFIGATTDAQDLLPTLKDRCNNLTFYLKDYTFDELKQIFTNKFASKGLTIQEDSLLECINRCRSSIREVDSFVNGLDTKAINNDTTEVTKEMVFEYFKDIDRDAIGLKSKDLEILYTILNEPSGMLSEDTLAARVHLDNKVLTKEFEPYLLKIGFLSISSRGRCLTTKAMEYLNQNKDEK